MSLTNIKHVLVVMLENRSFDNLLGWLYETEPPPRGQPFDGLHRGLWNPLNNVDSDGLPFIEQVFVRKNGEPLPNPRKKAANVPPNFTLPSPDPGEGFRCTNHQLFGTYEVGLLYPPNAVNLGFVINVIEDLGERAFTLRRAWSLAKKVLAISTMVAGRAPLSGLRPYKDGFLTRRATFQKYYAQGELKAYLEESLGVEAIPAEPGIFYLFRDEEARQQFLANRFRRRAAAPRKRASELRFEQHRELLEALMATVADLGRLPEPDEFAPAAAVTAEFGSLKRAFALVRRVTGDEEWDSIRRRRTEDLLVYLALARFRKRPAFGQLPLPLQRDVESDLAVLMRGVLLELLSDG